MGYKPKDADDGPAGGSEFPKVERLQPYVRDQFGRAITVGDPVYVGMGIFINRQGTVLDADTVDGVEVAAIHLPTEGVRVFKAAWLQLWARR
jgi:hypothetical protein